LRFFPPGTFSVILLPLFAHFPNFLSLFHKFFGHLLHLSFVEIDDLIDLLIGLNQLSHVPVEFNLHFSYLTVRVFLLPLPLGFLLDDRHYVGKRGIECFLKYFSFGRDEAGERFERPCDSREAVLKQESALL
jgi:hypothetical protein